MFNNNPGGTQTTALTAMHTRGQLPEQGPPRAHLHTPPCDFKKCNLSSNKSQARQARRQLCVEVPRGHPEELEAAATGENRMQALNQERYLRRRAGGHRAKSLSAAYSCAPAGPSLPAESVARVDPLSPHVCSPSAPGPGQSHHGDRPQGPSQSTALTG